MVFDKEKNLFVSMLPEDLSNKSFALKGGEALIVYAKKEKEILFSSVLCKPLDLVAGFNLIGIACPAPDYSAFDFLSDYNSGAIFAIQRYATGKGAFETAAFGLGNIPTGIDFPIFPGEGYFVILK